MLYYQIEYTIPDEIDDDDMAVEVVVEDLACAFKRAAMALAFSKALEQSI